MMSPTPLWFRVAHIFEGLEMARSHVKAAQRCDDQANAVYYRSALVDLIRLEAQVDGICYALDLRRDELSKWLTEQEDLMRKREKVQANG